MYNIHSTFYIIYSTFCILQYFCTLTHTAENILASENILNVVNISNISHYKIVIYEYHELIQPISIHVYLLLVILPNESVLFHYLFQEKR